MTFDLLNIYMYNIQKLKIRVARDVGSPNRVGRESHSRLRMAMCRHTVLDFSGRVATPIVGLTHRDRWFTSKTVNGRSTGQK